MDAPYGGAASDGGSVLIVGPGDEPTDDEVADAIYMEPFDHPDAVDEGGGRDGGFVRVSGGGVAGATPRPLPSRVRGVGLPDTYGVVVGGVLKNRVTGMVGNRLLAAPPPSTGGGGGAPAATLCGWT